MKYRNYKIKTKKNFTHQNQNYIKFELDDYVDFKNMKQNFIYCTDEFPFTSYQKDDEIKINLDSVGEVNAGEPINSYQRIISKKSGESGAIARPFSRDHHTRQGTF